MEKSDFDRLWKDHFYSIGINLEKKYPDYLSFNSSKKEAIYLRYERYRKGYKSSSFGGKGNIDRHKVASFLVCAIVAEEPMKIRDIHNKKPPFEVRISNELYAILSGITLLKSFILYEFKKNKCPDSYIQGFERQGILYPETTPKDGHYLIQLSRDIYLSHCQGKDTVENKLIPMLFHVFFFLEEYHKKMYHLVSENDENDSQKK